MQEQINSKLHCLVGLPLEDLGRAGDLVWFSFGKPRMVKTFVGGEKKVADFSLHVQCSWRITIHNQIVVESDDVYRPNSRYRDSKSEFLWDVPGANCLDEKIAIVPDLKKDNVVESVLSNHEGGLKITLNKGYVLDITPDDTSENEMWRFFAPFSDQPHFVVTGSGIEN